MENVLFSNCRNCAPFSRSVLYRIFVDVVSIVLIHFVTLLQEILHALARYMFSFHKEVSTCTIPFFARFLSFCSNWIVNAFWTYTFIPDALLLMHWHFLFCLEPPFRFYFLKLCVLSSASTSCFRVHSLALTLRFDRFITFSNNTNTF